MNEILDAFLKGLAGSSGKKISDGLSDVSKGLEQIKNVFVSDDNFNTEQNSENLNDEILKYFAKNIRNIEIEQLDEYSEYNDILKWAARNKCGDCLYLIKHNESKNKAILIFAFFGQGDNLLLDKKHPQRCYIAKELPISISDLFAEKSIFVQPFKK